MHNHRQLAWLAGTVAVLALCLPAQAQQTMGVPVDWSHRHLVVTNAADPQQRVAAARDPRMLSNWLRRTQTMGAAQWAPPHGHHRRGNHMTRDWSVSLGAGRVAPAMSPAKFGISTSGTPSCTSDYVAYGLDVAGTVNTAGGQANLVGLRNLYSGGATGNPGLCGLVNVSSESRSTNTVTITTSSAHGFAVGMQVSMVGLSDSGANGTWTVASAPSSTQFTYTTTGLSGSGSSATGTASFAAASVAFAYNITTASGGRVLTSPSVSLDGTKIAFVESTAGASIFHVLTLDPCVTSSAGCSTNGTSATSSAVPGSGNSASMVSITYSGSASNTLSSPWIDYSTNTAYVGDDNGTLYRIKNVFSGVPALDGTFGTGGALPLNGGHKLTAPVLAQGWLFVGDDSGLLWPVGAASPNVILGALQVGGGKNFLGTLFGIVDPVVVDTSTSGIVSVFATSGADPNTNHATLVQATLNIGTQTFAQVARADLGTTFIGPFYNMHAGALDNNYQSGTISSTKGFLYVCGELSPWAYPQLMRFGFTAGSPPTMNSTANGTLTMHSGTAECSPLTEFANPNLAVNDLLFAGDSSGEVQSFNITGSMPTAAAAGPVTESGGTSAIIVDTTQLANNQGSSIYFTTQTTNTGNCGTGNYCAIKLTQAGLQ